MEKRLNVLRFLKACIETLFRINEIINLKGHTSKYLISLPSCAIPGDYVLCDFIVAESITKRHSSITQIQ